MRRYRYSGAGPPPDEELVWMVENAGPLTG